MLKEKINKIYKEFNLQKLSVNFLSLLILQVLNVLLPFLTIPYLIKTLGLELFGLITFSYSFAFFFQILVEYGFNTIAAREISIATNDKSKIDQIFSEVISTKFLLLFFIGIIYFITVTIFDKFSAEKSIYLIQFGCVIGQAIFPLWFFHGIQKMKYITYVNIIFKTIFTILIFILVKKPSDYWIAPLCTALGLICSGVASLILVFTKFKVNFKLPDFEKIKDQLRNSFYVFISEIQIALVANGNILILGFFAGNQAVGIFSAAEKIVRAIANLISPLINTLYPHIALEMNVDKKKAFSQLNKIRVFFSIFLIFMTLILFCLASVIFKIVYGENMENSVLVFRILLLFPLLSFLDQLYGKLILLTNNREKEFMKVFFFSSIISVCLSSILSHYFGYIGISISNLIVQLIISYGMYFYSKKIIKNHV